MVARAVVYLRVKSLGERLLMWKAIAISGERAIIRDESMMRRRTRVAITWLGVMYKFLGSLEICYLIDAKPHTSRWRGPLEIVNPKPSSGADKHSRGSSIQMEV